MLIIGFPLEGPKSPSAFAHVSLLLLMSQLQHQQTRFPKHSTVAYERFFFLRCLCRCSRMFKFTVRRSFAKIVSSNLDYEQSLFPCLVRLARNEKHRERKMAVFARRFSAHQCFFSFLARRTKLRKRKCS